MPLLHCNECHHEWEGLPASRCDWCGADGYILKEKTELEAMLSRPGFLQEIKDLAAKILKEAAADKTDP